MSIERFIPAESQGRQTPPPTPTTTITVEEIAVACRIGDSADEMAEVTRLKSVAETLVDEHAPEAPTALKNEAVVRLCGYWFDSPNAPRGSSYANVMRNSGAGRLLLRYKVVRARGTAEDTMS